MTVDVQVVVGSLAREADLHDSMVRFRVRNGDKTGLHLREKPRSAASPGVGEPAGASRSRLGGGSPTRGEGLLLRCRRANSGVLISSGETPSPRRRPADSEDSSLTTRVRCSTPMAGSPSARRSRSDISKAFRAEALDRSARRPAGATPRPPERANSTRSTVTPLASRMSAIRGLVIRTPSRRCRAPVSTAPRRWDSSCAAWMAVLAASSNPSNMSISIVVRLVGRLRTECNPTLKEAAAAVARQSASSRPSHSTLSGRRLASDPERVPAERLAPTA